MSTTVCQTATQAQMRSHRCQEAAGGNRGQRDAAGGNPNQDAGTWVCNPGSHPSSHPGSSGTYHSWGIGRSDLEDPALRKRLSSFSWFAQSGFVIMYTSWQAREGSGGVRVLGGAGNTSVCIGSKCSLADRRRLCAHSRSHRAPSWKTAATTATQR